MGMSDEDGDWDGSGVAVGRLQCVISRTCLAGADLGLHVCYRGCTRCFNGGQHDCAPVVRSTTCQWVIFLPRHLVPTILPIRLPHCVAHRACTKRAVIFPMAEPTSSELTSGF